MMGTGDVRLIHGDCLALLPTLESGSVDAVVTDPPAGISFMGETWDTFPSGGRGPRKDSAVPGFARDVHWQSDPKARRQFIAFLTAALAECLRVTKPGGRLLCWAIPRTSHWTGTAIEDAGWIIEDRIAHLFGQGFPKAKSKLKPACEDWWLARKPSKGVPALPGLDACRIGATVETWPASRGYSRHDTGSPIKATQPTRDAPAGRWPANLALSHHEDCRLVGTKRVKGNDRVSKGGASRARQSGFALTAGKTKQPDADGRETAEAWECARDPETGEYVCPVALLDEQAGERGGGSLRVNGADEVTGGGVHDGYRRPNRSAYTHKIEGQVRNFGDAGGASRFFYCAKASRKDRGEGNTHPTVKSQTLMRWLVRLICLPGDTILDPFAGSGSTGKAAVAEGFGFIGIEKDAAYFAIARKRLAAARPAAPLAA